MNLQSISTFLNQYKFPIAIALVVLIVIIFFYVRSSKKRGLRKQFDALEVRYNELMSIPVLFKINKATGLAKLNPNVESSVIECKALFNDINKNQEEITQVMADTEDALAYNKLKDTALLLENLEELVEISLEKTHQLDQDLEKLLEQETAQRLEITNLKDRFRELKQRSIATAVRLGDANDTVEDQVRDIEHAFSTFEEWMYASDFKKAKEVSENTKREIDMLEARITEIPKLYEVAKGHIPSLLDEISKMYQGVRQSGVYIEHLEVAKNIGVLSEILKDDLIGIGQGEIEKSKESLMESQKRLEQLGMQIQKEDKAHQEVQGQTTEVFENLDGLSVTVAALREGAQKVETRFNFEGYVAQVEAYDQTIKDYDGLRVKISRMIEEEKIPASTILISINELGQDVVMLKQEFSTLVEKVEQANADEIRAEKQLMKLYLIINDVQVRIKKRSLPIISDKYSSDIATARNYTRQISDILKQDMIDMTAMNATVDEAIDYIYKLHNNVNNLVGVVDMCENAIVYANKFRAFVPDIDAELTRAELSFNNGEYTQALTTVINAIDHYRPGSAYEEMIRDNAKSAR
ncbi:septation ring formation regulator EzrA [Erysipelothrix sp. HDW6C]|uniref:septation ring formation regulator EzrA n=1 Tax=Erysipelothrix sp. HDW6C TaxID=2714930 RepID=UPI00140D9312|nr:septation ring formation regulator EzrA [Erysipelothrix sp. HDW6C]QIK70412.1 septation ring formation regulator EzrA [Erysipelothrix sp. HDW6C]